MENWIEHCRAAVSRMRRRHQMDSWRRQLVRSRQCCVHKSLQITGAFSRRVGICLGHRCNIESDITIWLSLDQTIVPRLEVGNDVFIGRNTYLGVHEPVTIGSDTMIGAYCYIISANHRFDRRDIPMRSQGFDGSPTTIEADVWLGTHVVVLPGVTIGKGAIVGAGSVVNRSIPSYQIWGGAPARFLKDRP